MEARVVQQDSTLEGYAISWQLELIENHGTSEEPFPDTFWIAYLADGFSCDSWAGLGNQVELNDTVFLNLFPTQWLTGGEPSETVDLYSMSICNRATFHVSNGIINGSVQSVGYSNYDYNEFLQYIGEGYLTDFNCVTCSCYYCGISGYPQFDLETFCSTFRGTANSGVGRYQILEQHEYYLLAQPIERLAYNWQGWGSPPDPIKIWGTRGEEDCRASIDDFEIGKDYILNLYYLHDYNRQAAEEQEGDYQFMDCGVVRLEIEDEVVIGPINDYHNSMPYDQFAAVFPDATIYFYDDCGWWTTSIEETPLSASLKVFPNPTDGVLFIEFGQDFQIIRLIDANGVSYDVEANNNKSIDLSGFPNGLYFLQVRINGNIYTERVLNIN